MFGPFSSCRRYCVVLRRARSGFVVQQLHTYGHVVHSFRGDVSCGFEKHVVRSGVEGSGSGGPCSEFRCFGL